MTLWKNLATRFKHYVQNDTANAMMVLTGLSTLPGVVLTPIVSNWQLKHTHMPDRERKVVINQEIARQVVGFSLHFMSYFGGAALMGKVMKKSGQKTLGQYLGGIGMSAFTFGVIRPLMTNSVFMKFLYPKKKDGATDEASEKPAKVKNEVKTPDAGIQVSHKPSLNHSQDQFISTDKAQAFPATQPIASAVYAFRPLKSPT